ncbi:hypothetical protein HY214_05030 [Candidatus Roizmanbacteria bacterium]|nr:hypothetical protein [Candidatus Roizmanbacteria bacterium]
MKWKKLGRIFTPDGKSSWMKSHAALPFAETLSGNWLRVYFNSRDTQNRCHVASLELNITKLDKIRALSKKPLLSPGDLGSFDEFGAMLSWKVPHAGKNYIYYVGWDRGISVPFRNSTGLAYESKDGKTFKKVFEGPILDRSIHDPCFMANPCVLVDGKIWKMWYLSCVKWRKTSIGLKPWYHLKYAESSDGISWDRTGIVCIDFKDKNEHAISRPCVLKENGIYKMWFSYRGKYYQIGYAESRDGKKWTRMDQKAGLSPSKSGWDSKMVEYPFVFDHQGKRFMFYNGNDYGKTGFGLAVWEGSK